MQSSPPPPTKNQSPKKKKHGGGHNAAISLSPPFTFDGILRGGMRIVNVTSDFAQKASDWSGPSSTRYSTWSSMPFKQQQFWRRGRLHGRAPQNKISATRPGPRCPQPGNIFEQDEDCLFLNIYRPADNDVTPMPVIVFIHGGGWQNGAGSDYDPTSIVRTSYLSTVPVMIVTINYRLGILGFAASSDLANLANLDPQGCASPGNRCTSRDASVESAGVNLGYQDIKMALNWTFTNIAAFGGDPGKVTIWGQSAGAFGVSAMLVGHQGAALGKDVAPYQMNPPRPPFRAAIMMSGSPSGPPLPRPVDRDNFWHEMLVALKCDGDALNTPAARIDCVRKANWQDLRRISQDQHNETDWNVQHQRYALSSYPYTPVLDGGAGAGGFFGVAPSVALARGDFARVPLIAGDCEDEGTLFAPTDFSPQDSSKWLQQVAFANTSVSVAAQDSVLHRLLDVEYPNDPAVGSPYDPSNGNKADRFFVGSDNPYKQLASLYGDLRFQAGRRQLLDSGINTSATPVAYSYQFMDPSPRSPVALGTVHGADLDVIFGNTRSPLTAVMARQWASFATRLDPNGNAMPNWPPYDHADPGRLILMYKNGGTGVMADTYRQENMDFINTQQVRQLLNN